MAIINGTANKDTLNGTAGNDQIFGFGGDDWIDGGAGADWMEGGAGDDFYIVDNLGDQVIEDADGGEEDGISSAFGYYVLPANVEHLDFWAYTGTAGVHGVGNALGNRLYGRNSNDILDGGTGADYMYGGLGDDTYYVDNVGDWVDEEIGEGYDSIYTTVVPHTILAKAIERLIYTGTANVTITASSYNNDITTDAGNDVIDGGGGKDYMRGGRGDDIYYLDSAGDQAIEQAGEGTDTVRTTVLQQSLNNNVENMSFIGTGDFVGFGNALANRIEGGTGADQLYGLGGNDVLVGGAGDDYYWVEDSGDQVVEAVDGGSDKVWVTAPYWVVPDYVESVSIYGSVGVQLVGNAQANALYGGDGDDILNGGAGADIMGGGKGNDTYYVDHAGDFFYETENSGFDTVIYALNGSYTLGNHVEKLVYTGTQQFWATGNGLNNVLVTSSGNDVLNGKAGADTMEGKAGNDSYFVDNAGDLVIEKAGEGTDTVYASTASYILPANVENLVLETNWIAFAGTGNALANRIEGGSGNDILDGGAGADTLIGGGGDDIYVLDDVGDRVTEYDGGGTDEIRTTLGSRTDYSKMYVLPDSIENLTGTSATGQGVYANALNNVVTMGAGGDLIVMQDGGNDIVKAGGGDDFVYYGDALTIFDSNDGGDGFDTLGLLGRITHEFTGANMTNFEKLALYSSGGGAAMPNHYDITLSDANVGAGKKLMVVAQSLLADETLIFNGAGETNGSFNVRGGRGADIISGGAGADLIFGSLGADILSGGEGKDVFEYSDAAESNAISRDTILDFDWGDKINLKNIDADGNPANGNSKFVFIGEEVFSGKAGELRTVMTANGWSVEADITGDGSADLTIAVHTANGHLLGASDFYL